MVLIARAAISALLLSSLATAALAQATAKSPRPDPTDPGAEVPPLVYRSALARAGPPGEQAVGSWRDANDRVWHIGGWRAYAREASQAPAAAASAVPAGAAGAPRPAPK